MKKIISFAAILILLVNLAACSTAAGTTGKAEGKAVSYGTAGATSSGDGKPSISVYYMMYNNFVSNAILEFKSKYPNVNVIQKFFYVNSDGNPQNEDYMKSISTDILSGGGPDVFVCMPSSDIDSMNKLCSNGVFSDLNEFISKDKDFKLDNYYKNIIDIGVFNGKRVFIPLYYNAQYFFTAESILKQNKININEDSSIKDLSNIVDEFSKNKTKKSKYLFGNGLSFYRLMNMYGENFLDFQSKKSNFNSDEFKDLLRLYKKMQPLMATEEAEKSYSYLNTKLLKDNVEALLFDNSGNLGSFYTKNCVFKSFMHEELKIIKISGPEKADNLNPIITDAAAINNNCKNKQYAYEFIKILLSDKIQRLYYSESGCNSGMNPVSSVAFKKDMDSFTIYNKNNQTVGEGAPETGNTIMAASIPLTDSLVKRVTNINNNMDKPIFMDKAVRVIIDDALEDYLAGKKDEDQTAQLINNKVELFLNE